MGALLQAEQDTYSQVWQIPGYHEYSPGEVVARAFMDMSGAKSGETILDAGCGSGKGALALRDLGFLVSMCDITDSGLLPEARSLPYDECALWWDIKAKLGRFDW